MPNPELSSTSKLKLVIEDNKQTGEQKISFSLDGAIIGIENFSATEKLQALSTRLASEKGLSLDLTYTDTDGNRESISVTYKADMTDENKELILLFDSTGQDLASLDSNIEYGAANNISKVFLNQEAWTKYAGKGLMKYALSLFNIHLRSKGVSKTEAYISKHNPDRRASLASEINAPNLIEGGYNTVRSRKIGDYLYLYVDDLSSSQPNPPDFDALVKLLES